MAKSIRSKWKRKMRAVKRIRYGEKELERLKRTVENDNVKKELNVVMTDVSEVVTVTDVKSIKNKNQSQINQETETKEETINHNGIKHKYNVKTLKDQFGSYPVWMHQRKISKNKKARKGRPKRK